MSRAPARAPLAALLLLLAGPSWAAPWARRWTAGAGGEPVSYLYRAGAGVPVVLIHGLMIGAEGFEGWREDAFPGRPLLVPERRGYGAPPATEPELSTARDLNAEDLAAVVAEAGALGWGPPGVAAVSLGAMVLPPLGPAEARWVALLSPGAAGMLPPAAALAFFNEHLAASAFPLAYPAWAEAKARALIAALIQQVFWSDPAGPGRDAELSGLQSRLGPGAGAYRRAIVAEWYWSVSTLSVERDQRLPAGLRVLAGRAEDDEVVPAAAYARLVAALGAAGNAVEAVSWPGRHRSPLTEPGKILPHLHGFDARVLASER